MDFIFWLCLAFIIYTYAGFPALVGLLARCRSPQSSTPPYLPSVTLLISACNEEAVIASKLQNSLELDYPRDRLQLLVAADGSDDQTVSIAKTHVGIELSYHPERRGKMAAISHAMEVARGDIIVFSDANNLYDPQTLRELVSPFHDPAVGAVSGAKSILKGDGALGDSEGLYWKYEAWLKKQETRLSSCTAVAGEVFAIRRHLFQAPPATIINDDFYLAMRILRHGFRIVYAPLARSSERVSLSAQDELTRRSRIIAGRYQALWLAPQLLPFSRPLLMWQVISHKFFRPLIPFAMLGALVTTIMCTLFPSLLVLPRSLPWLPSVDGKLLLAQVLFYSLAIAGNYITGHGLAGKLLFYLPTFLVNSNAAALIGLYRFLRGRETAVWTRVQRRNPAGMSDMPHQANGDLQYDAHKEPVSAE